MESELAQVDEYPLSWKIMSSLNGTVNLIASLSCFYFMYALLSRRSTRTNTYNLYVVFLIIPDALNTWFTGGKLIFVAITSRYFPAGFYEVYNFVWYFYFTANFYLNAVVAYEINTLVANSYQRKRSPPPTPTRAFKQIGMVYLLAILLAVWVVLPVSWSCIYFEDARRGYSKLGSPPGGLLSPTAALATGFTIILIPVVYVLYVRIRMWKLNLLPKSGRTRVLSLFFMRIIIIFLVFYLPKTIVTAMGTIITEKSSPQVYWLDETGGLISALQAFATLYMISLKDDIREAITDTYCCQRCCSGRIKNESIESAGVNSATAALDRTDLESGAREQPKSEWAQPDVYTSQGGEMISS